MNKNEIFDCLKEIYNQDKSINKLLKNITSVDSSNVFILVEIFESFKNDDEIEVKKILSNMSTDQVKKITSLLKEDDTLQVSLAFVKGQITSARLKSFFSTKDGL